MPDFLDASLRHPIRLPDGTSYPNTVWLAQVIDHPNMRIGDFTYYNDFDPVDDYAARIAPYLHPGAPETLIIGKFGQFAHGTRFITSSADHPKRWFSAYPFAVFNHDCMDLYAEEFGTGRDTVIGNDVWIGHNAMILPGVTVGDGAIIGAGAVVRRDVDPYMVMGGNPAEPIRRRFSQQVTALLLRLRWWDLELDQIRAILPVLASADVVGLQDAVARYREGPNSP
ncbi:Virginiamycin A acetyltransferase [Thalassovita gelatinovora]|uniref:Virginiamycin A acetyltransferase n=1 Tax=Thalassovita gelatinovora TaxID=53501 RepID=A0A0P1FD96_THAGE|nr:CatB-related O-acetyltransferase [Thalassovita gelatinovora]QIZ81395.1 CatB-related O-acetyltransferase [Thalassovita gelatinovora]CUH66169.1 Virginiamycin A acetyltransferase [Thalassovita gelatinovora]SEQ20995.1 virginiamycin A acetyltransferase [Thalassovita gelatinovora]